MCFATLLDQPIRITQWVFIGCHGATEKNRIIIIIIIGSSISISSSIFI